MENGACNYSINVGFQVPEKVSRKTGQNSTRVNVGQVEIGG